MPFKAYQLGITLIVKQDDIVWKIFLTILEYMNEKTTIM